MISSVWKYSDEKVTFKMDFSYVLSDNETISKIVSVAPISTQQDITIETFYNDGFNVYVQVSGGTSNTQYTIKASVQTVLNNDIIDGIGHLAVY